jgi:hypothetical protein
MKSLVVFIILLLPWHAVAADQCGRKRISVPAPYPVAWAIENHHRQVQQAPAVTDVLLVGDSHAHHWPATLWDSMQTFNTGLRSDFIEHVLWRFLDHEWRKLRPANVILFLGSNNLARGDCAFAIVEGLDAVLARLATVWPDAQLFLVSIPPRGPNGSLRLTERVVINDMLERRAAPTGVVYVETDELLRHLSTDQTHYVPDAYRALTLEIAPLLRGQPRR